VETIKTYHKSIRDWLGDERLSGIFYEQSPADGGTIATTTPMFFMPMLPHAIAMLAVKGPA
jgi:hypothetical protein